MGERKRARENGRRYLSSKYNILNKDICGLDRTFVSCGLCIVWTLYRVDFVSCGLCIVWTLYRVDFVLLAGF